MADEKIINDSIDLQGAPHVICEILRESLSVVPEKTDEELWEAPVVTEEETNGGEDNPSEEEGEQLPEE